MKKLYSKFSAIILSLILVLSNSSILSLASKVKKEEYLAPYITMFEEFKQILEILENNDEPFVIQDDNHTRFRSPYDSDFDGGVPGVSSNDYDSSNGLRRFPSSEDGSGFIFLESLSD